MSYVDRAMAMRSAALLLGGAAVGLGLNAARPAGVALRGFEAPTACTAGAVAEARVVEMEPREASTLCGRPGIVFADTRPAPRFEEGHVADAVHLPCDAAASGVEEALARVGRAQTIIVYGESSDDGHDVAETLRRRGFPGELRVLRGGFAAWEREGLACASGPCKDCLVTGTTGAPR
jgi:rhodanese-related sulfurtransferase